ncbi:agmatinase [candidate division KSB1 bacterium]|nr:agmatinase [candidate division KSB1 bacterium]
MYPTNFTASRKKASGIMVNKNNIQFLQPDEIYCDPLKAGFCILPYPFEGGISFHSGTAKAPQAVLQASSQVELYDEMLDAEPFRAGICTLETPNIPAKTKEMADHIYKSCKTIIEKGKYPIVLGGDHSISPGFFKALCRFHNPIGVIQLDAHADLRDQYEDDPHSHASVMARIREQTEHTLQLGIRSMCIEEADLIKRENLAVETMHELRKNDLNINAALERLPDKVFLTIDVDVFDTGLIQHTGTPEPGGLTWYEALGLLREIFAKKNVVGFDLVELACHPDDWVSPFAVARLLYKIIGLKINSLINRKQLIAWPKKPLKVPVN